MGAHDYYDSMERVTNKSDTLNTATVYEKYYLIKKNANKWSKGEISSERLSEIVYGITNTDKIK